MTSHSFGREAGREIARKFSPCRYSPTARQASRVKGSQLGKKRVAAHKAIPGRLLQSYALISSVMRYCTTMLTVVEAAVIGLVESAPLTVKT